MQDLTLYPHYMRETLRWPWWFTLIVTGLDFSIVIALWAGLGNLSAIIGAFGTMSLSAFFYQFTSLTIEIDEQRLRVGSAHIERHHLGSIETLDRSQMQFFLREGFDTNAYYAIRFWVKTGLRVSINDPRDPTTSWIISTKRTAEIQQELEN